jgi:hypothetical protein
MDLKSADLLVNHPLVSCIVVRTLVFLVPYHTHICQIQRIILR